MSVRLFLCFGSSFVPSHSLFLRFLRSPRLWSSTFVPESPPAQSAFLHTPSTMVGVHVPRVGFVHLWSWRLEAVVWWMWIGRFETTVSSFDGSVSISLRFFSLHLWRLSVFLCSMAQPQERPSSGYRPHPQPAGPSRSRAYFPTHMTRVPCYLGRKVGSSARVSFPTPLFVTLAITSFYPSCFYLLFLRRLVCL